MSAKTLVMIGMVVGSAIGGFIPTLFGADLLSFWPIITSAVGAFLGIWIGYKLSNL